MREAYNSKRASLLGAFSFQSSGFKRLHASTQAHFRALDCLQLFNTESFFHQQKLTRPLKAAVLRMRAAANEHKDLKLVTERQLSIACRHFYQRHLRPLNKLEVWILDIDSLSISFEAAKSLLFGVAEGVSSTLDGLLTDIATRSRLLHDNVAQDLRSLQDIIDTLATSRDLRETCDLAKAAQSSENEALVEWQTLGGHIERLHSILPDRRELNMVIVDSTPFKFKVSSPLLRRMEALRQRLVTALESDTNALRQELKGASETLVQSTLQSGSTKSINGPLISLSVYLEQMNVVAALNKQELR